MFRILSLSIGINILLIGSVFSQNSAPTLQAGLSGVTFTKGDLDTEVIAKLIAEKQEELKIQLIKSMLLSDLEKAGGVVSAYANDLLNVVLSGSSPEIKTRNIVENTVNIAVVLAFVNHYVGAMGDVERANINKLAISMGYVLPSDYKDIEPPASLVELIQNPYFNNTSFELDIKDGKVRDSKYNNEALLMLAAYLIDITAVALEENEVLKERGLFQFAESTWYNSENLYLKLGKPDANFSQISYLKNYVSVKNTVEDLQNLQKQLKNKQGKLRISNNDDSLLVVQIDSLMKKELDLRVKINDSLKLKKKQLEKGRSFYAKQVHDDIVKYVEAYVKAFGVFDFIYRNELDIKRIDTVFANALDSLASEIEASDKVPDIDMNNLNIENYLKLVKHLRIILAKIPEQDRDEFESFFSEMEVYLIKKKLDGEHSIKKLEQVYLVGNKLLPVVQKMVVLAGDTTSIEKIFQHLELSLVSSSINDLISELKLTPKQSDEFKSFYELFGAIQNLDDIDSYEKFLKSFYLTLDVFADGKLKSTLETIINLTGDHMEFVKTDSADYVNVDVEGIIVSLSDMNYDRFRWLKFYLTVGGNTMHFLKEDQTQGENKVDNFQYFGEKIGVKIKLYDWAYLRSFSSGETFSYWGYSYIRKAPASKPVVSDVHLLAYGSGLLYNIAGTSSNTSIDNALWGVGLGVSFNNGLDFNISRGHLFAVSDSKPFWNIGFDIRFTEYIKALSKK